jgi:hypothetical protein
MKEGITNQFVCPEAKLMFGLSIIIIIIIIIMVERWSASFQRTGQSTDSTWKRLLT